MRYYLPILAFYLLAVLSGQCHAGQVLGCVGTETTTIYTMPYSWTLWSSGRWPYPVVVGTKYITCSGTSSWQTLCNGCDGGQDVTLSLKYAFSGNEVSCKAFNWRQGGGWVWSDYSLTICQGKIDTLSYICKNVTSSGGAAMSNIYVVHSATSVLELQGQYLGTCQELGYCKSGVSQCEYDPSDSSGNVKCKLNGDANGKCYYQCQNGKVYGCKATHISTLTEGSVTSCPTMPDTSCAPEVYASSASSAAGGSAVKYSSSSDVNYSSPAVPNSGGSDNDYSGVLTAIHDTLHVANDLYREQSYYQWSIDSVTTDFSADIKATASYAASISANMQTGTGYLERIDTRLKDTLDVRGTLKTSPDTIVRNAVDSSNGLLSGIKARMDSIYNHSVTYDSAGIQYDIIHNTMDILNALNPISFIGDIYHFLTDDSDSKNDMIADTLTAPIFSSSSFFYDSTEDIRDTLQIDTTRSYFNSLPSVFFQADSIRAVVDSIRRDTSSSKVDVDSLVSDSAALHTKFSHIFFDEGAQGGTGCYIFDWEADILGFQFSIVIDLSNVFGTGFNLCAVLKYFLILLSAIVILFIYIKTFKSSFGGSND